MLVRRNIPAQIWTESFFFEWLVHFDIDCEQFIVVALTKDDKFWRWRLLTSLCLFCRNNLEVIESEQHKVLLLLYETINEELVTSLNIVEEDKRMINGNPPIS